MPAIVLTAAERWMTGVLSVDPVVLSIVGQYHPETDVLLSPNVHSHTVPEEDTKATLADESIVDLPRYPCVLISNYYEGTNAMEEALAILDTDPEYFVSGVFEGRDMIGVVRDGEQLGDHERLALRIRTLLHDANGVNAAGVIAAAWEIKPYQRIGDRNGVPFCKLGSHLCVLVESGD
jgi:hypothetical protein